MDLGELRAEIGKPEYQELSDAEVAVALKAKTWPAKILSIDVTRYLTVVGQPIQKMAMIEDAAGFEVDPAKRRAARALIGSLARFTSFDLSVSVYADAINRDLDACVDAGLIDGGDKAAILSLGDNKISRIGQLGWPDVSADDIATARKE